MQRTHHLTPLAAAPRLIGALTGLRTGLRRGVRAGVIDVFTPRRMVKTYEARTGKLEFGRARGPRCRYQSSGSFAGRPQRSLGFQRG
jgi:hypothetical protein